MVVGSLFVRSDQNRWDLRSAEEGRHVKTPPHLRESTSKVYVHCLCQGPFESFLKTKLILSCIYS